MKIGCCAYSYRKHLTSGAMTMEDFIDLAAEEGFEGVELTNYYFDSSEASYLHSLKRRCLVNGLSVAGAAIRSEFTRASQEERAAQVTMVKEWVGHAVELGAPEMRVFAGNTPEGCDDEQAFRWTVEGLAECAAVAAERGVVLALENHGGITTTADQVIRLIEAVDSEWLRLNMDTGNFRESPYEEMTRTAPLAVTAHMKASVPTPQGKRPVDVDRVIGTLHAAGYRGFLNIEYEEEEDPRTGVPKLMRRMQSALAKL